MSKSARVRAADALAVVRLVNDCRDLGADAAAWQARLLAGLNRVIGATVGVALPLPGDLRLVNLLAAGCFEGHWPSEGARRAQVEWMNNPVVDDHPGVARFLATPGDLVSLTRREMVADDEWEATPLVNDMLRANGLDDGMMGRVAVPATGGVYTVTLVRPHGDPAFPARAGRVAEFALRELAPHLGRALLLTTQPNLHGLSARLREVLARLLDGDAEKAVAARLGLRPSTVHDHVKALYRHFGVGSRGELLAYFLRRYRGGGA